MKIINNPKITVVIPCYNVEEYIDRCVQSIVNQTYFNLEILLINDGSTDKTSIKLENWAKKDPRIRVIHKENSGLGMARNSGIEKATGKYISFIDSDDFVDLDIYQLLLENLEKNNADTSYCSLKHYFTETKKIKSLFQVRAGVFTGKEVLYDIIGASPESKSDCQKEMSVCAALFSLKIINENNIRFVSEREFICEDLIFDFQYLAYARKVVVSKEEKYFYCVNRKSLTHKYNSERFRKNIILYEKVIELINKTFNDKKLAIMRFNKLFMGLIRTSIIQEVKNPNVKFKIKMRRLQEMIGNDIVQEILKEYPYKKNPLKQRIFNSLMKDKKIILIYIISILR